MKQNLLGSTSTNELWILREKITGTLAAKITAKKEEIEDRLSRLGFRQRKQQDRPKAVSRFSI